MIGLKCLLKSKPIQFFIGSTMVCSGAVFCDKKDKPDNEHDFHPDYEPSEKDLKREKTSWYESMDITAPERKKGSFFCSLFHVADLFHLINQKI